MEFYVLRVVRSRVYETLECVCDLERVLWKAQVDRVGNSRSFPKSDTLETLLRALSSSTSLQTKERIPYVGTQARGRAVAGLGHVAAASRERPASNHSVSIEQFPTFGCLRLVETVLGEDDRECTGEPRDLRESLELSIVTESDLETYRRYESRTK